MRTNITGGVLAVLAVVVLFVAYLSLFTVYQTRQALVVRLGDPVKIVTEPGLHAKLPLIDTVIYVDNRMVARGLNNYSLEGGFLRRNYGVSSFDYGQTPSLSGSWRRGLSDFFTIESHGEGTAGLYNAGAGGLPSLKRRATLPQTILDRMSGSTWPRSSSITMPESGQVQAGCG